MQIDPMQAMSPEAVEQKVNVVPMNFSKEYKASKTGEGFDEYHTVDLVKKGSFGEKTPWKIAELQKDSILWPVVEPYYQRWLAGLEDPVEGTPLDVLSFIPASLIDHLKLMNIRTAEDLAEANDSTLDRIGMGARRIKEKCVAYLENKQDSASASEIATLREENDGLRAEIEELKKTVNSLVDNKPKRGRPRKS